MESRQRSSLQCNNAAQCLRSWKDEVLRRWETRARQELPAAAKKRHYHLLDSLPQFLDVLIESLDQRSPRLAAMQDVAESHATQRVGLEDYTLEQVQAEYTILRQAIFEVLEEHAQIDTRERNIILDFIVEGRVAAADEYMRLAQSQILWSKEHFALALDSAGMGSFDFDVRREKMTWSDTLIRLHGMTPSKFTGRLEDFWPCVHSEDRDPLRNAMLDSLRNRVDFQADYRVIWPDGGLHWISTRGRPYFDEEGKPIRILGTGFEVTERKEMEKKLRQANEAVARERSWYEMILNQLPTPITLISSRNGETLFTNEAARQLRAEIPKEITEEKSADYYGITPQGSRIPANEMPRFRIIRGEEIHDFELTWVTPKGTSSLVLNGKLLPPAFGHPPVGLLSIHDVTTLKGIEGELRQSEAKFRILFESDLIGVVFGDVGGGMAEMNQYFLNLIGYTSEEVRQGKVSWVQLTPPEYFYLDEQAVAEMKQKGYCAPYEKPFVRKDGSWVWVMMTAIFTDPSKFKHVAIVLDVTDRKRTQEALQQSEHELRLINESIPQIVWAAFPDASLDHYNQNWERYTGLSPSQHCSSMWRAVLHPDDYDRTVAAWNEAQKSERFEVEHRMRRHDGVYRWFLSRARPLRDENGNIARWYGTSTDIEDQKRTQWALERERDLREQFVNTLSHDLRNPLSAAKASAQIIARYPDRTDRIPSLATRITDSIGRADKMIEDLLDANRIRAGKGIPLEIKQCDLSEIAEKVCEELATVHGDRFVRDFSPSLEGYWSCKDLYRLLENLITNALKYGSSTTPVTVHLEERGKNVEIAIHNWGEPISPEDQKRLFDPFMRSKAAESGEKKGWGLGLTLVRGVTDAHGGRVEVESHRGSGTTFRVILPRDARSDRATRD